MKSEVAQSCPTLCDPMDCSPPGSSMHGIVQARILECIVFLSPGDLPNLGIELGSPTLQEDSLLSEPPWNPYEWDTFCKVSDVSLQLISVC